MRSVALTVVVMLALPTLAFAAMPVQDIEGQSGSVFTAILKVVTKWVFPVCAVYCFLYGVIGKGVKRGEWDIAAVCAIAAIALALFPTLLKAIFDVQW